MTVETLKKKWLWHYIKPKYFYIPVRKRNNKGSLQINLQTYSIFNVDTGEFSGTTSCYGIVVVLDKNNNIIYKSNKDEYSSYFLISSIPYGEYKIKVVKTRDCKIDNVFHVIKLETENCIKNIQMEWQNIYKSIRYMDKDYENEVLIYNKLINKETKEEDSNCKINSVVSKGIWVTEYYENDNMFFKENEKNIISNHHPYEYRWETVHSSIGLWNIDSNHSQEYGCTTITVGSSLPYHYNMNYTFIENNPFTSDFIDCSNTINQTLIIGKEDTCSERDDSIITNIKIQPPNEIILHGNTCFKNKINDTKYVTYEALEGYHAGVNIYNMEYKYPGYLFDATIYGIAYTFSNVSKLIDRYLNDRQAYENAVLNNEVLRPYRQGYITAYDVENLSVGISIANNQMDYINLLNTYEIYVLNGQSFDLNTEILDCRNFPYEVENTNIGTALETESFSKATNRQVILNGAYSSNNRFVIEEEGELPVNIQYEFLIYNQYSDDYNDYYD